MGSTVLCYICNIIERRGKTILAENLRTGEVGKIWLPSNWWDQASPSPKLIALWFGYLFSPALYLLLFWARCKLDAFLYCDCTVLWFISLTQKPEGSALWPEDYRGGNVFCISRIGPKWYYHTLTLEVRFCILWSKSLARPLIGCITCQKIIYSSTPSGRKTTSEWKILTHYSTVCPHTKGYWPIWKTVWKPQNLLWMRQKQLWATAKWASPAYYIGFPVKKASWNVNFGKMDWSIWKVLK